MNDLTNKNDCFLNVRLTKEQHAAFRAACRATETKSISGVLRELVNAFTEQRVTIKRKADVRSIYDVPTLAEYLQTVTQEEVLKG